MISSSKSIWILLSLHLALFHGSDLNDSIHFINYHFMLTKFIQESISSFHSIWILLSLHLALFHDSDLNDSIHFINYCFILTNSYRSRFLLRTLV